MKILVLGFIILFAFQTSYSQEKFLFANQVSMYEQFDTYIGSRLSQLNKAYSSNSFYLDFNLFAFGYRKWNTKTMHEFTIMPLDFNFQRGVTFHNTSLEYPVDGFDEYKYRFFTDYKYSFFLRKKDKKFIPFAGMGLMYYFLHNRFNPKVSNMFPRIISLNEINVFFNIGFIRKITESIHFTCQIPIILSYFNLTIDTNENPQLPAKMRTSNTFDIGFLPKRYFLMMGFNFLLNKAD